MAHPQLDQAQPSPHNQPSPQSQPDPSQGDGGEGGYDEGAPEGFAGEPGEEHSLEENVRRVSEKDRAPAKEDTEEETKPPAKRRIPTLNSQQLAALHKREQSLVSREGDLSAREKAVAEAKALIERGKHSPFEALKVMGWDNPQEFLEKIAQTGGEWTQNNRKSTS